MPEISKYDLIPCDRARRAWEALPLDERLDDSPPASRWVAVGDALHCRICGKTKERCSCCPRCGWPRGERGFVRLPFPRWHEFFGRAICCPSCWPWPFGHAEAAPLSAHAHNIAALWDKVEVRERVR